MLTPFSADGTSLSLHTSQEHRLDFGRNFVCGKTRPLPHNKMSPDNPRATERGEMDEEDEPELSFSLEEDANRKDQLVSLRKEQSTPTTNYHAKE